MGNKVFRDKSIERISSPEQLNDYIRVTTPSVWIILLAAVILLFGMVVWCAFGRIEIHDDSGEAKLVAPIVYVTD